MCGGRLVHLPCSHLGHIARAQPYSFPGGRRQIEVYNYKRAVEVWMQPEQKQMVYDYFPEMKVGYYNVMKKEVCEVSKIYGHTCSRVFMVILVEEHLHLQEFYLFLL